MKKTFKTFASFAVAFAMVFAVQFAEAANFSAASDNMTRQKVSESSDHVFTFTPQTTTGNDIVITFPGDFDLSSAASAGNTVDAGAGTVTVTGGVTAGTPVTVTVTGVVNPAGVGNQTISLSTGVDTGEITVPIVADDQIQITAKVDQVLFFDVRDGITGTATDNAVQFGTLTSGAARYATDAGTGAAAPAAASELEAGTNASGGYVIDVTGETLTAMDGSGNDIDGLFTAAASSPGTEQFGINVSRTQDNTGAVNGTVAADYATNFHLPDSGVTDTLASNPGPSSNEIYDVTYLANISSLTPAGNYTTVLTYTMTSNF